MERRGVLGNVIDPHVEGANHLLGTLNPPNTYGTNVATVVSASRLNFGPNGAGGGAAAPTLAEPECSHLWWVASCDHCDSTHGGILRR